MANRFRRLLSTLPITGALIVGLACMPSTAFSLTPSQAIESDLQRLDSGLVVDAATRRVADLQAFYRARGYRPLWIEEGMATGKANTVRRILADAAQDGLDPSAYDIGALGSDTPRELARFDVALSAAVLRYVGDLRNGRVSPGQVEADLYVEPRAIDTLRTLNDLIAGDDIAARLRSFVPANPRYLALRDGLAAYRRLAERGGWHETVGPAKLEHGESGPAVAVLRQRLRVEDTSLPDGPDAAHFDDPLRDAVIRFQQRHGLDTDGIVGPRTRAAMNVPLADRIRQIIINMERWRWMPNDLGRRHIMVNIAGFELDTMADGLVLHKMRVVVGKTYRKTPVFSAHMTWLEINPYWHVPPNIAIQDMLPKIRQSVSFLAEDGFRVFDGWGANASELNPAQINWSAAGPKRFPWKLRQDPGPKNALGQIKFMFPNDHNVYLHDTPTRSLFYRTVRLFSSGCIRVEDPRNLALFVLDGDPQWARETLAGAFETGETRKVVLPRPLAVHITYQTAWVDEAGGVQFRDDVYGRDETLSNFLFPSGPPAKANR